MATLTRPPDPAAGQRYCRGIFIYRSMQSPPAYHTVVLHLAGECGMQFVLVLRAVCDIQPSYLPAR